MNDKRTFICDWCGTKMVSRHCKEICPNCGQRWDCSDTTIWVGDAVDAEVQEQSLRTTDFTDL